MASTFSIFSSGFLVFFCYRGKSLLPWPKMAWVLCCWNAPTAMIWRLMSFLCKLYVVFFSIVHWKCLTTRVYLAAHLMYCNMRMTRNGLLTVMCVCNARAQCIHNEHFNFHFIATAAWWFQVFFSLWVFAFFR